MQITIEDDYMIRIELTDNYKNEGFSSIEVVGRMFFDLDGNWTGILLSNTDCNRNDFSILNIINDTNYGSWEIKKEKENLMIYFDEFNKAAEYIDSPAMTAILDFRGSNLLGLEMVLSSSNINIAGRKKYIETFIKFDNMKCMEES